MRKLSMSLSPKEIDRGIRYLQKYKKELNHKVLALVEALTNEGANIAKLQVRQLGAIYTGELESSITGIFNASTGIGVILAGAWYATAVEFGTGVVGENSPHPQPDGWNYDVNSHGESGWWYMNNKDGIFHWTKGMPSRPFMYNTVKELEKQYTKVAREVFGRD